VKKNARRNRGGIQSQRFVEHAFELAHSLGIAKMLVQADAFREVQAVKKQEGTARIIWLATGAAELPTPPGSKDLVVKIPEAHQTRIGQVKMGLLLAVLNDYVGIDESIMCLSGAMGARCLDTLTVAKPRRHFPWLRGKRAKSTRERIATPELGRLVDIALRFATEGREGRSIGTIFVLGDTDEIAPYTRQLVLNPCEGHPQKTRNIHSPELVETLRELSALDGALIVNKKGVVESAGTYLDAPVGGYPLRRGLGARHAAAGALTGRTNATAVVISESSGAGTVFHDGKAIIELENPKTP